MKKLLAVIVGLLVVAVQVRGISFDVRHKEVKAMADKIDNSLEKFHESYDERKDKEAVFFYEEACSLLNETQNTFMEEDFSSVYESLNDFRPVIDSIRRVHNFP